MSGYGHNSASFGQLLTPVLPAGKAAKAPKAPKGRFPYFKFYPRDWIEATRDMSLEARGAYIDLICIIMEMEGHLADNDAWISHQMHVSTRKWRSMKEQLVKHEKIRIEDGKIVNERCLKELDSLLTQRRNLADSAVSRERTKREKLEKANENNGGDTTTVPLRARVTSDTDSDLEKKEEVLVLTDLSPDQGQGDAKMTASKAARIAFERYNETARKCGLPQATKLSDSRKRSLALRVREAGGLEGFDRAMANLEKSAFLHGRNDRGWKADLDWLIQPAKFMRLLEGGYGNGAHAMLASSRNDHLYDGVL